MPPAPSGVAAADFTPFLGSNPNGTWSLYVVDDQGGDSGSIARGWQLSIEWEDAAPVLSNPMMLPDGRFQTTLQSLPRMTHVIEASSDLATWTPISTNTLSASSVIILDPPPPGVSHRFYRAIRCP
jgi:subtilisin-like proprotein convertase family protein